MVMPGKSYSSNAYRYGFQGQEKDDEVKGSGNSIMTNYRSYDPRLGRWWSVDPKSSYIPFESPYSYAFNSPIAFNDSEGDLPEPMFVHIPIIGWLATLSATEAALLGGMLVVTTYGAIELSSATTDMIYDYRYQVRSDNTSYYNPNMEAVKERRRLERKAKAAQAAFAIGMMNMRKELREKYSNNGTGRGNPNNGKYGNFALGVGGGIAIGRVLFLLDEKIKGNTTPAPIPLMDVVSDEQPISPLSFIIAINADSENESDYNISANYLVQEGDNLTRLAERFKTTIENLVRLNGIITHRDSIYTGDTIIVHEIKSERSSANDGG
jgi:RHS repeat-associated protein